ncbi:hypothetical protein Poli38472_005604 [Pythium oligandrum]|uniref:Phosphatidylinositol N-acetylglucosaminyltransferase n=1 Tax=Pythium oligandrum TaxID=41045 RepID=A0A8K1FHQ1_PYTOL|nr:hypothetical protein Poli38472_005604 [Pythium oligandrum]|eukprot:TMW62986.1 hypothetical protein Poli38472_005604 [Pythium oligandrum]
MKSTRSRDDMTSQKAGDPPKWRKILYETQPFEDNYVDSTFLEQLRTNANVRDHDYWGMVRSAAAIIQQICAVLIFFSVFVYIEEGTLAIEVLACIDAVLAVGGYLVLRLWCNVPLGVTDSLRSCLLFCATLSLLSPVLRTLTRSYADDTIWALAALFALVHLISHDYVYVNSGIGRFSGTISLNAAILMAVLLGSRLHSNEQVFAFILLAIEIFAVFPMFQREVKQRSEEAHLIITVGFFLLSALLTYPLSVLVSTVSSVFIVFVAFVCPLWFMHVQEYKNEILGPWDIVHVQPEQ